MNPTLFPAIYFSGLLVASVIRWHYSRDYRALVKKEAKRPKADTPLVYLPALGMFVLPVVYAFSSLLSPLDYPLPVWAGCAGVIVYASAIWLLWRSHVDLGSSFSPVTGTRPEQCLVTAGVYSRVRHPMYSAHLLWGLAQPLLLWNWIAGFSMFATMLPLYLVRVGPEEQMMIDRFGDEYREYMERTGRLFPKFSRGDERIF
ncbi:MAG TPA: protein-S-isoprenylcysteine O-methyltransferase [Methanoregulaceae archaeon]|jgi:protein-S-isoprenylcysteine O-methyltransferase Ste14|nr:protein-S-isoprenylcysteine O-methyltransferase [Methanoregulaceae archaeon]HPJ74704.1 protein-S-isoprenylcysteine O-methyltransferase [Methanoregulaceae archaeon]HQC11857.1 protein-S-isoprenylcysteine O-methyltransferase [Methanoregulaceae archaeon]